MKGYRGSVKDIEMRIEKICQKSYQGCCLETIDR